MFIKTNGVIEMFNLDNILSNLDKVVAIEVVSERHDRKKIVLSFPTDDLDESYSLYSNGEGFLIKWEGMNLINKDFKIDKDDFAKLFRECLKELTKREKV